jgi:GNAT superfamily N-acetyltransferase
VVDDFNKAVQAIGNPELQSAIFNAARQGTYATITEQNIAKNMAAGAVAHQMATSSVRRNMPDPVPVMVLARLAVDLRAQGIKLGASLLQDAVNRAVMVAENAGVRALLVHALNDKAKEFYEHYGFQSSSLNTMTLMLRLNSGKP